MTEKQAKAKLGRMLDSFTAGSILHLLGDIFHDYAEEARHKNDAVVQQQAQAAESALYVVGLGIDAACPR